MKLQKLYNPMVAGILRSPLHGVMSKSIMLLAYKGRRSGKTFATPISYIRDGDDLLAIGSRKHSWWKNLRGGAAVRVRVRGRELEGTGWAFEGEAAEGGLLHVLRTVPAHRKHWGVELDEGGQPNDPTILAWIARENSLVRIGDLSEAKPR